MKSTVIMDRWSKSGRRENNLMVHMIPEAYRKSITLPIQTDVYYFEAQTGTVCTWKGIVARRLLEGYTRENIGSGSGYRSIKKRTKWKQEKQIRINRLSDVVIYNGLFEVSCRIFFPIFVIIPIFLIWLLIRRSCKAVAHPKNDENMWRHLRHGVVVEAGL